MAVAINKGMNDPPQNASTLVIAFCFIGNCTFPSYSIVGLCHSTHDISEQVRISGVNFEYSYIYGSRNITLDIGTGSSITLGLDIGLNKKVLQTTSTRISSKNGSGSFKVYMLMDNSDRLTPNPESTGNVSAFSAEIYPCVRTYNASVRDFVLSETELSSTPIGVNQNPFQETVYIYLLATSRSWVNGTLLECQPSQEESTGMVKIPKDNVDATPGKWPAKWPESPYELSEQQSL